MYNQYGFLRDSSEGLKQLFKGIKFNKKNKTIILAIELVVLVLLLIFILRGCGIGGLTGDEINGFYKIESVKSVGEDSLTQETLEEMQANGLDITLDVRNDGSAYMDFFGQQIPMSYDLKNKTMSADGNDYPFKYSGDKLIWKTDESTMTFKRQE